MRSYDVGIHNTHAVHLYADDVEISGVVVPRWDVIKPGERCTAELVLLASTARLLMRKRQEEVDVPPELADMFQVFAGRIGQALHNDSRQRIEETDAGRGGALSRWSMPLIIFGRFKRSTHAPSRLCAPRACAWQDFWDRQRDRPFHARNKIVAAVCPQVSTSAQESNDIPISVHM